MLIKADFLNIKPSAESFVTVDWLEASLQSESVKVLDATWIVPGSKPDLQTGVIPQAQFFDLGYLKTTTPLGERYPPPNIMAKMLSTLGISKQDHVIVYDRQGFFSAPRVAWSLCSIGHQKTSVLRGGLPVWKERQYSCADSYTPQAIQSVYMPKKTLVRGVNINDVVASINTDIQIVDARPASRFYGEVAEPRPGLRSGHIPGSFNLPLSEVKQSNGKLLKRDGFLNLLNARNIDLMRPIITTCGSGVTAAALAWLFYDIGKNDIAVYSGSWAEYGASNHPIETT